MATGLREILDREPDIEVVGLVASPEEAHEVVDATAPDVVLIDAAADEGSSGQAARRLRRTAPDAAYVVLGGPDDDASIIEAVAIGAMGHIAEVAQPAELVETIRRVALGDDPLQDELRERPDLLGRVLGEFRDPPGGASTGTSGGAGGSGGVSAATRPAAAGAGVTGSSVPAGASPEPNPLTAREIELLRLVSMGMRNREIAARLDVAEQTIKNQLRGVMRHLAAPNRTQAVVIAMRNGWLPEPSPDDPPSADI